MWYPYLKPNLDFKESKALGICSTISDYPSALLSSNNPVSRVNLWHITMLFFLKIVNISLE